MGDDSGWECAGEVVGVGGLVRVVGGWEVTDAKNDLIVESANQLKGSP